MMMTTTDRQTDHFTSYACMWDNGYNYDIHLAIHISYILKISPVD